MAEEPSRAVQPELGIVRDDVNRRVNWVDRKLLLTQSRSRRSVVSMMKSLQMRPPWKIHTEYPTLGHAIVSDDEWELCVHVQALLDAIPEATQERGLRSFSVECCRRYEHLLSNESRYALDIAGQLADGKVIDEDVTAAINLAEFGRVRVTDYKTFKSRRIHPPQRIAGLVEFILGESALTAATEAAKAMVDFDAFDVPQLLRQYVRNPN